MTNLPLIKDVPMLRKYAEWAESEYQKGLRGEASEWRQTLYVGLGTACGTVCCLAGRVVLDLGYEVRMEPLNPWMNEEEARTYFGGASIHMKASMTTDGREIADVAAEALGLDEEESSELFRSNNNIRDIWRIVGALSDGEIQAPVR